MNSSNVYRGVSLTPSTNLLRNFTPSSRVATHEQATLSSPEIRAGGAPPFVFAPRESNYPVAFPADTQFRRANREAIGAFRAPGEKRKR